MCKYNYASYVKRNSPHRWDNCPGQDEQFRLRIAQNRQSSPVSLGFRFCLTLYVRLNYYYIAWHGQTHPTEPENRGTETVGHAQSPCGNRGRSLVQAKPFFRSPRSSAGPLRDAATPHRRTDVNSRRSGRLWRFTSHVLSSASVFRTVWTGRLIARSAGAEGWAQAERGSSGVRGQFAEVRPQAHHRSVRQSHSRAFCNYCPQTQSRASSGATQKKTTSADLRSSIPADAAAAYETLRPHLIDPADQSGAIYGRAVLLRRGMLAWASTSRQVPALSVSPSPAPGSSISYEVSKELIQVMAGLILHHGKDSVYA